ncbi:MAG: universal stress protein [Pricia sp.]|nr:universal stress protein [Pricia sp.]
MKTILYATDYSQNSVAALQLAHLLAQKFKAKLIVMHVFDIPITLASPVSVSYMKKEKKLFVENRAKLATFCSEHLEDDLEAANINFVMDEDGSVWNGILGKATKFDADMIVVGTKGASPVKEFLLGRTTKALIRKAQCLVLAVPENAEAVHFKKMVYATAFEQADILALQRLVNIAKKFDAQVNVVHIITQKEYAGEEQMEWFKEMLNEKVDYKKLDFDLIFSDRVFEELVGYLKDSEADLLAMLERKDNTFYQKYLQRDMVKKMANDIERPLLSFNVIGLD